MAVALVPERRGTTDVPSIDGFRGLAVLWIVLGHCWHALGGGAKLDGGSIYYVFIASYFGIDLLFIVSGFVLFLPAVLHDGSLGDGRDYALRRAARILPGFYAAMIFTYAVAHSLGIARESAGTWLSHALFLHQPAHSIHDIGFGINGAMWTMSVEVLFYAALPLVAAWYYRRPFVGLALAVLGTQAWQLLAHKLPTVLSWTGVTWAGVEDGQHRMVHAFPSYLAHFAVGMTAAWLYVRVQTHELPRVSRSLPAAASAAALVAIIALARFRGWQGALDLAGPFDHTGKTLDRALLFGALVLATALASARAQWPVRNRFSRLLGTRSYGIYLSHTPLIYLLMPALGLEKGTTSNLHLLLLMLGVVPLSIACGVLSFALLEEPFRRWARGRRPARRRAPRPVALAGRRG